MGSKYYIIGGIVAVVIAVAVFMFFNRDDLAMKRFASSRSAAVQSAGAGGTGAVVLQKALSCPSVESLQKEGTKWTTVDGKWETYTPSLATKVLNFIGAQWVGIKIGKIICLYQTNEAVSFPIALEQTRSQLILEPNNMAWSALVGNRRFCKSASVADCPYFLEQPKDISNVYKEIEYAPDKDALN